MTSETRSSARVDRRMVVGLDDSPGSTHALRWAAAHCGLFGSIQPVATWHLPWWAVSAPAPGAPLPPSDETFTNEIQLRIDHQISEVPADCRREPIISRGTAGPTLVQIAAGDDVLVVGTRGRGAIADTLLGSVSLHCVTHAEVPVVVVPTSARVEPISNRVVVGIDGSENSIAALTWALDNTPPAAKVEAVFAWSFPVDILPEVTPERTDHEQLEVAAKLDRSIDAAVEASTGSRTPNDVMRRTVYGDPRSVLRDLAGDADLLVLGARGTSGLTSILLGSMTTALCHQPVTTTVVVPAPESPSADQG